MTVNKFVELLRNDIWKNMPFLPCIHWKKAQKQ
jgi:hypothetical protein